MFDKVINEPTLLLFFTIIGLILCMMFYINRHENKFYKYLAGYIAVYLPCLWAAALLM